MVLNFLSGRPSPDRRCVVAVVLALGLTLVSLAVAQSPKGTAAPAKSAVSAAATASVSSASPPSSASTAPAKPKAVAVPVSVEVQLLRTTKKHVDAFVAGTLDTAIDAFSLFDIDIANSKVVVVEARRLEAVIARANEDERLAKVAVLAALSAAPSAGSSAGPPARSSARRPVKPSAKSSASANLSASAGASAKPTDQLLAPLEPDALRAADPVLWRARLDLDIARFAFYRLDDAARSKLLTAHDKRRDAETKIEKALDEVDEESKQAEREKQAALEAGRRARSEAEKAVYNEQARLLDVTKSQVAYEKRLIEEGAELSKAHDTAVGWQRRVQELIQSEDGKVLSGVDADKVYGDLRAYLKATRNAFAGAIQAVADSETNVPVAGPDRLGTIPSDLDRSKVDAERKEVMDRVKELSAKERALRVERARLLMGEVDMLNRLRLELLPFLSQNKRRDITGFTAAGVDQARSEGRQVWLTLRHHLHTTQAWVTAIREGSGRNESAFAVAIQTLKWVLPVALFWWWRRRADGLVRHWREQLRDGYKKRLGATAPVTPTERALGFLARIRRPAEWLLLLWAVLYLVPTGVRTLLEVQLVSTALSWMLGGSLVVAAVDALSSEEVRGVQPLAGARDQGLRHAPLRLRSLRLVGRAVVLFGLILALSDRLVGKGTVYQWALTTCWFSAIPIFLVVVTWWRPAIYERLETIRKKNGFERWALSKNTGLMGAIAAASAGCYLFATGVYRVAKGWVVTFTLVRRLLAYLFRRGMSKQAEAGEGIVHGPIDDALFNLIGPETPSTDIVPSVADAQVAQVVARIKATGGGVFAIVGERGAGKSTLVERIANSSKLTRVTCPTGGVDAFKAALNRTLNVAEDADIEIAANLLDGAVGDSALLVDDAHHLMQPRMGGLREFDRVLELARDYSTNCTWVFAFDDTLWRFLEQARGAIPLFDDVIRLKPWSEEGIVRLLSHRNEMAGIDPSFDDLLTGLPDDADDIDVLEGLQRTEGSYYRLLWDYASGNPGIALHFWRRSLGADSTGQVRVRIFDAPDAEDLLDLPDTAAFVLRATIQLGWATLDELCLVTALPARDVKDALRYGSVKGYFVREGDKYQVPWNWFRAITRYLTRRHLLVGA